MFRFQIPVNDPLVVRIQRISYLPGDPEDREGAGTLQQSIGERGSFHHSNTNTADAVVLQPVDGPNVHDNDASARFALEARQLVAVRNEHGG
jgi:hypothetical protein